jgi:hypothetical protein
MHPWGSYLREFVQQALLLSQVRLASLNGLTSNLRQLCGEGLEVSD